MKRHLAVVCLALSLTACTGSRSSDPAGTAPSARTTYRFETGAVVAERLVAAAPEGAAAAVQQAIPYAVPSSAETGTHAAFATPPGARDPRVEALVLRHEGGSHVVIRVFDRAGAPSGSVAHDVSADQTRGARQLSQRLMESVVFRLTPGATWRTPSGN